MAQATPRPDLHRAGFIVTSNQILDFVLLTARPIPERSFRHTRPRLEAFLRPAQADPVRAPREVAHP
mgnify:CR=1 FL=1